MTKLEFINYLRLYLDGKLAVQDFCSGFEHAYNFTLDRKDFTQEEIEKLKELFDVAAYYNPSAGERKNWPGFKNEDQVKEKAQEIFSYFQQT